MNAFDSARAVEAQSLAILLPYLKERAYDGRLVLTSKGVLARHLQERVGDIILNTDAETFYTIELKAERRETGNLFLEDWSNLNLDSRQSHADRGSNPGWLVKSTAQLLMYHFLDADTLHIFDMFKLQRWAFGSGESEPHIYAYRRQRQNQRAQANDTWGRLVPVAILHREIGGKKLRPKQIEMFGEAAE